MRVTMRVLLSIPLLTLLTSCAGTEVIKYNAQEYTDGVVFYRSTPYLSVASPDKDGSQKLDIIYLPDPKEQYVVRTTGIFGTATMAPNLAPSGVLLGLNSAVDKTASIDSFISTLTAGAKVMASPIMGAPHSNDPAAKAIIPPGLYKIDLVSDPPTLRGPIPILPE